MTPVDPTPAVRTERHTVVDIPIAGGSTLRVAVAQDGEAGDVLILAHGFGGGDQPFRRPDYTGPPIRVRAEVLPEMRAALEALQGDG